MTEIRWLVLKSPGDLVKRDEIWDEKFVAGREGGGEGFYEVVVGDWRRGDRGLEGGDRGGGREKLAC